MATKIWGNEYRSTVVYVDSYENGVLNGSFYNPFLKEPLTFQSATSFLRKMEDTLDRMKFPQAYTTIRSFSDTPPLEAAASPEKQAGTLATFTVRVLFRQNSSWQGTIRWENGNREESFRSVLELLLLMDSALHQMLGR